MWYRVAADAVLVVHLLFIGFVVGGVFLAWRWPRVIWMQLPAMVYGALIEFVGFTCPLTPLQNYLQRRAGEAGYSGGFISHYLIQWIYPAGLTRGIQIGLGLFVLLIAVIGYGATCVGTARPAAGELVTDHPSATCGAGLARMASVGGSAGRSVAPGSFGLRVFTRAAAPDGAVGREPGRAQRQPGRGLDLG